MKTYGLIFLSLVILLSACAPPSRESGPTDASVELSTTTEPEAPNDESFISATGLRLPGTFTGTLPCADCEGIHYHLDLWPDQVYQLRREWLKGDSPLVSNDIGRWSADPIAQTMTLRGGGDSPLRWEVQSQDELRLLNIDGESIDSSLNYSLKRESELSPAELEALVMSGLFTYMADAAQFRECRSGRSYPVSMEADYLALERAYLDARSEPGAPVFATIEGGIVERPAMEGAPRPHVVVTRLKGIDPVQRCEQHDMTATLTDTYWKILELDGEAMPRVDSAREPHIILHGDEALRFTATVGCNQFAGGLTIEGDALRFGETATTRMACPPPLDTLEQRLSAALPRVVSYRQNGDALELLDADAEIIARLRATYFR